jgi:uncharacterized protein YidB (DUF937 family)
MGLREILNGMLNGPRGQRQATKDTGSGRMSPIMMALLGYLAYKAFKGSAGGQSPNAPARSPNERAMNGELIDKLGGLLRSGKLSQSAGNAPVSGSGSSGDIADMVRAGLKTVLGGAGAGAVLSGGLGTLIKEFQQRGHGPAAQTWVSTGPNRAIAPNELADALGNDTLDELSKQTGMRREEVIAELCKHLPQLINQLTPNGRVPTIEEASRMGA